MHNASDPMASANVIPEGRQCRAPSRVRAAQSLLRSMRSHHPGGPVTAEILASPTPTKIPLPAKRWAQLAAGLVCMMAISSPQYVWTLFTKPLTAAYGVPLSTLQVTFSILIVLQTFLSPFQGWLVDRFGPRMLISAGVVAHRIELGIGQQRYRCADLVSHLRTVRRHRHRHRLYWCGRSYGALVSGSARPCRGNGSRGLRHGCTCHYLSHQRVDRGKGSPEHTHRVRHRNRSGRLHSRAIFAQSSGQFCRPPVFGHRRTKALAPRRW